jgi:23S rRNA (uracil1939-C5)-methyltransferase
VPDADLTEPLHTTALAVGGAAVARAASGRVVFVDGALPGETVRVEPYAVRRRFAKARLVEVLDAAPERQTAPCPHHHRGCGGCAWQDAQHAAQLTWKRGLVAEALSRQGGAGDPDVREGPPLAATGHRTTLRCVVTGGRAGFRQARSHDPLAVDSCLVAHPLLDELLAEGRFEGCREVTLRAGARTGERLVLASPTAHGVQVPDDVVVVGRDELERGRHAWIHEEVADRRWRVSATSFFQARPDGADALVDLVAAEVADLPDRAGGAGTRTLVDLCCGVGLFAGAVGQRLKAASGAAGEWRFLGVERHGPAVADARHNLSDLGEAVRLTRTGVAAWKPAPADVIVADPARDGLGAAVVSKVAATGAPLVVLVSCDPASLGRDARLLGEAGYRFVHTTLVDLFPHTPHVEAVSRFVRTDP